MSPRAAAAKKKPAARSRAKRAAVDIDTKAAVDVVLVLRTVDAKGRSYEGRFQHPKSIGERVEAPDWNAAPIKPGVWYGCDDAGKLVEGKP